MTTRIFAVLFKINSNHNKFRQELENNGVETLDAFFKIFYLLLILKDIVNLLSTDEQKIQKKIFLKMKIIFTHKNILLYLENG